METSKKPQLFLLHYAGGNCYSLRFLKPYLQSKFELIFIELPGRGQRITEPLIKNRMVAVEDLVVGIEKHRKLELPFAIYGHSMGATLAFDLTKILEKKELAPTAIIVTGNAGPNIERNRIRYDLSQSEFIKELKKLGGVPDELFSNMDLFDFFEPILRADFEIVERYAEFEDEQKINAPIYCAMGEDEEYAGYINNWANYTTTHFSQELFTGNHFFINEFPEKLGNFITTSIYDNLAR